MSTQQAQERGPVAEDIQAEPKLRHDPPTVPGYRLEDRPAIPISKLNLLSIPLAIPFGVVFYIIGAMLQPGDSVVLEFDLVSILILMVIVLVAVPIFHEVVHGAIAKILGARPFFGVGNGYAYTSFHEPVSRQQYALITVAPLAVISLVSFVLFPLNANWFLFVLGLAVTNAAGAIGDLWVLWRIRRLPQDALIYDLADGYAAFVPERHPASGG